MRVGITRKHEGRHCWRDGKLAFPSEAAAHAFLRRCYRKGRRWAKSMRVYLCPHCSNYHTTSRAKSPLMGTRN